MTGTGTWSGGTMVFNGTTNAFSNTAYAFPFGAYSMFAVYSNTTAPAASAYMNAVYGSNGFPMLGTFGVERFVSAGSVVANRGSVSPTVQLGWAARISSTGADAGFGIASDAAGNVLVTGQYTAGITIVSSGTGSSTTTLPAKASSTEGFVAKYSSAGAVLWGAWIEGTNFSSGRGIATDPSGNVLVTGYYAGTLKAYNQGPSGATVGTTLSNVGGNDCFVAKYSSAGAVLWAARIGSTGDDRGLGIATDSSGDAFVTGQYNGALTVYNQGPSGTAGTTLQYVSGTGVFIAKYSSAGAVLWAARITNAVGTGCIGNGIATDTSGNVLVAGQYGNSLLTIYNQGPLGTAGTTLPGSGYISNCFVAKYSSAGAVVWAARVGEGTTLGTGIAADVSGNVFVTGYYDSSITFYNQGPSGTAGTTLAAPISQTDCFIAKYSSAGAVLWAAQMGGTGLDRALGIATDPSGNAVVTGWYGGAGFGNSQLILYNTNGTTGVTLSFVGFTDCFVAKYSSSGVVLWGARLSGNNATSSEDRGFAVATDPSGNVLATGIYTYTGIVYPASFGGSISLGFVGTSDCFVVKYSPNGNFTTLVDASSNVLMSATYTPSTFSSFVNGFAGSALSGTTLTTTGIFVGGPSNYFSGSISEVLVFGTTLTAVQRQSVEGYLSRKWGIGTRLLNTHPFYTIPPFNGYFNPIDVPGCSMWLDAADAASVGNVTYPTGIVLTLATSGLTQPTGITVLPNGIIVVVRGGFIYLVTYPAGVVTVLAGGGSGSPSIDGTGTSAYFSAPRGVAVNSSGNLIAVSDASLNRIRLITYPGAVVTTLAGSGTNASIDGTGAGASFSNPAGVAFLSDGNIVVAERGGNRIRLVTPAGVVTTLAGSGANGRTNGTGTSATFFSPNGVAVLPNGIIVVADGGNHSVRLVTYPGGVVTTLAGSGSLGSANGTGTAATFYSPTSVAVIPSTSVIVVGDQGNNRIRLVTYPGGVVTTYAGNGGAGLVNGLAESASFSAPYGVAVLPNNDIVVSDENNNCVRLITTTLQAWNDKSGQSNHVTGLSGGTLINNAMIFNGTSQAFSNTTYVFPTTGFSMFAVYSNTTAPAGNAYMNAVYGSGGFPMLGTFGAARFVSARGVVANTGALSVSAPAGWAAQIASGGLGFGVATDSSDNVFVTGYYSGGTTLIDGFITKYSSAGNVLWAAQIAGTNQDIGWGIATDPSGNVAVTGEYQSALTLFNTGGTPGTTLSNNGFIDCFVAKYSSAGVVLWAALIGGQVSSSEIGRGIATDSSGNVFVTGNYDTTLTPYSTNGTPSTTLSNTGGRECFLVKYSSAGAVLWATRIGATSTDFGNALDTDSSNNVFVTGYYSSSLCTLYNADGGIGATLPSGVRSVFVAKYSSAGAVLWAARITSTSTEGNGIATDTSGNVVVTGQYNSIATIFNTGGTSNITLSNAGSTECFVAKYSSAGAILWAARIGSTGADFGQAIATDMSGNVLVTGYYSAALSIYNQGPSGSLATTLPWIGNTDCFIVKYSSDGAVLWATQIAGTTTSSDRGNGIATNSLGNVFVAGQYGATLTLYNTGGSIGTTLTGGGGFLANYRSDGYIANPPIPASSNVLVSATYTPSIFSPFVNGYSATTLAGTVSVPQGIFVGGPSNYFSGSISELLIYSSNLSVGRRQQLEGYLIKKWGLSNQTTPNHPYRLIQPVSVVPFQPSIISTPLIWFDAADTTTIAFSSGSVISTWSNKGSSAAHATARTGSLTSGVTTFNGGNIVNCPASANLGFTLAIPNQPRAWFAVFRLTSQLTTTGTTQYFAIVNRTTTGTGQDAITGPMSPTNIATNTYSVQETQSDINIRIGTATAPNGFNVMSQYGYVNSAASTASNFITVNGTTMPLTNNGRGGYNTTNVLYVLGDTYGGSGADIAEIVMFNTELTTPQRQQMEGYLGWKWGIARTLPTTHPYYKYPPGMA